MISSGMLICSFYLKKRYTRSNSIIEFNKPFECGNEKYNSAMEAFKQFCEQLNSFVDDEKSMKLISVDQASIKEREDTTFRAISFTIFSGSYGIEGEITDRNTHTVNYKMTQDDANVKKFKCIIYIPKDAGEVHVSKGIMVFQTLATYGVKTITVNYLKDFFASKNLTFETRSVSVRLFLEKLIEQGKLQKITLINNHLSPDPSDSMLISSGKEEITYYYPILKREWTDRFLKFAETRSGYDVFEINDTQYEDIKVTFKIGKSSRTVRLNDVDRFSVIEEIPETVYNNGRYIEDELIEYMISTADNYCQKMVLEVTEF